MKNLNFKYTSLSILFLLSLVACEKDAVNVDVPIVQPQLVVAGFLSPSLNETRLVLSWSAPIYNTTVHETPFEKDAKVFISEGSNEYQLNYTISDEAYIISRADLPIIAGKKYSLRVESNKSKSLIAETVIPVKPVFSISYLGFDSVYKDNYYNKYDYYYYVKLKISNTENTAYYRINSWGYYESKQGNDIYKMYSNSKENRIIHGDYVGNIILQGSSRFEGSELRKIYVEVEKVDETYYRYHNGLENYSDIDIFTEPTLIYSNVENALGVFCSFNSIIDSLEIN